MSSKPYFFFCAIFLFIVCLHSCAQTEDINLPLFPCSEKLNNPYGVCSNISNGGRNWEYDRRDAEMAILHDAGIRNVRTGGGVNSIAPDEKGVFHPQMMDSMVLSCQQKGITIEADLFLDAKGRAWDDNYVFYEKYVRYISSRYKGRISYWETTNEVNRLKGERNLVDKYSEYLRKVYPWLKQSDSNIKVLLSGLGDLNDGFIEELSKRKSYEYFDIMNFHSYEKPEKLVSSFKYLAKVMHDYGWKKTVWLTECGLHTALINANKGFYEELVPFALSKLGMSPQTICIGIIDDDSANYLSFTELEEKTYLKKYKEVKHIDFTNLKNISISKIPVVIAANSGNFPASQINILIDYVRRGGTIITPFATPFYYDLQHDGSIKTMSDRFLSSFHMSHVFPESLKGKLQKIPSIPSKFFLSSGYRGKYKWDFSEYSIARYADEKNLKKGDELIPFIKVGDENYVGCVAGIYKLNSDLKGNVIFQTRILRDLGGTEEEQAAVLPRIYLLSFSYGIDKVFWYNLRSRENDLYNKEDNFGLLHKDLSPKPAFIAYKFLVRMCPDQSSRPILKENGDTYIASWFRPDKKKVHAIWSLRGKKVSIKTSSKAKYYDLLGNEVKKPNRIGQKIVYVVGADMLKIQ